MELAGVQPDHGPETGPGRLAGHSVRRVDGAAKVSGAARYAGDLSVPGMLHARLVSSPYAHARIEHIDSAPAMAVPGVVRVVTAAQLPLKNPPGSPARALNPLAREEVSYYGQPVAVVLAQSAAAAEDGAAALKINYRALPVTAHLEQVTGPEWDGEFKPDHPDLTNRVEFKQGDIEQGFAAANLVVDETYRLPMVHQSYLEPQTCLAVPQPGGGVTLYASSQALFATRRLVATGLGLPLSRVKVVIAELGGGFGGKGGGLIEPLVAALAVLCGQGVLLAYTRMEDLAAANPMPDCIIRLKTGAKEDGTLTALQASIAFNTGAYPGGSPLSFTGLKLANYYTVPHYYIEGYEVVTHRTGMGAYRAPGGPQSTFAIESHMDTLAHRLGLDPLEIRRRNANPANDSLAAVLARLEDSELWRNRLNKAPGEGWGLATGSWATCMGAASAGCRLESDGTLVVTTGVADISGVSTSLAQIAGEVLGVSDLSQIRLLAADSDSAPHVGASGGSQIAYNLGGAVQQAARQAAEQIKAIGADMLEAAPDDLELFDSQVRVKGAIARAVSFQAIGTAATDDYEGKCAPVYGQGNFSSQEWPLGSFAHLAHVRVDRDTGQVSVLDYLVIQDVGFALNPALVYGQVHGGALQGLGWALWEQMVYDRQGNLLSNSLMDYALPVAAEVPRIMVELVDVPSAQGPFGAKGVGEAPIVAGAGAVANAIFDATGIRVRELPATPERVFRLLKMV